MRKFLSLLFALVSLFGAPSKIEDIHDALLFISAPRSGTHLTNLALELFTHRPFYRIRNKRPFSVKNITHFNLQPNYNKKPYFHTHFPYKLKGLDRTSNQLLLLLRNPKELVLRYAKTRVIKAGMDPISEKSKQIICKALLEIDNYKLPISILKFFNRWPKDKRLIISYEDLISTPQNVIQTLTEFLDESDANIAGLFPFYVFYRKQMLKSYDKHFQSCGGSLSKGSDILYHTRSIPHDILLKADALLQSTYPQLWDSYLSRYATKDPL